MDFKQEALRLAHQLQADDTDRQCIYCSKDEWGTDKHDEGCQYALAYRIIEAAKQDAAQELRALSQLAYTPGVVVTYHGPSNSRGSRVSLDLPERDKPRRWIAYDYALNSVADMAAQALKKAGFEVKGFTDGPKGTRVVLIDWQAERIDDKWPLDVLWAKVGK